MPKIYFIKKTIKLTNDTNEILNFCDRAMLKYKNEIASLTSLTHSDAKPNDNTILTSLLTRVEYLIGQRIGAESLELSEVQHLLSADAYSLFQKYKHFLIKLMYVHRNNATFDLITSDIIDNRSVLVHEILIRLVAEALDDNQQENTGNVVLAIMRDFYEQLKKE